MTDANIWWGDVKDSDIVQITRTPNGENSHYTVTTETGQFVPYWDGQTASRAQSRLNYLANR